MKTALVAYVNVYKSPKNGKMVNKDVWEYFSNYVPKNFDDVDLMLFDPVTIKNIPNIFNRLNQYDNLIVAGKEPLKYLNLDIDLDKYESESIPELTDEDDDLEDNDEDEVIVDLSSKIDDIRYSGIINTNKELKFKKIHVIYSLIYYEAKNLINVFKFDVLNRIGKNDLIPKNMTVVPNYHHISEFKSIFESKWSPTESMGIDFESRGFPMDKGFRILGFSICNDSYQSYFYFSRNDEIYQKELGLVKDDLISIFKNNAKRLFAFNNKFENNVILDILGVRVFFEDARVFTQILKTRGSLKFSANLFLGVNIWNEDIINDMNYYKKFVEWMNNYKKVIESSSIDYLQDPSDLDEFMNEFITSSKLDPDKIEYHYDDKNKKIIINKIQNKDDFIENPALFILELQNTDPEWKNFFINYSGDFGTKFKITNLLEYFSKDYNEWQIVEITKMGYYCILDSYYTYKLKEMIYDTNYQGVKDGYEYYISQTNLAGIMESTKIHIDKDRFIDWMEWAYRERLFHAKTIANDPMIIDNYSKSVFNKKFSSLLSDEIKSVIASFNGNKRVVLAEIKFIKDYKDNSDKVTELMNEFINKLSNNYSKLDPSAKLTKTAKNKILTSGFTTEEKCVFKFIEYINKKFLLNGYSSSDKDGKIKVMNDFINHVYNIAKSKINYTIDDAKDQYLKLVNDPDITYDKLDKILEFSTTKDSSRLRMLDALLPNEMRSVVLQFILYTKLKSTTIDPSFLKSMSNEEFIQWMDKVSTGKSHEDKLSTSKLIESKSALMKILTGKKLGKHALRLIKHSYDFKNGEKNNLEDYPRFIQLNYHLQLLKRYLKSISTVIEGQLGGGSFVKSSDDKVVPKGLSKVKYSDVKSMNPEDHLYYKTTFWQNDKDTLRWSSSYHTIPSTLDYTLCFTPRKNGRFFIHFDMAQSEVRITFAITKEQKLVDAILNGLDIHSFNANNAFDLGFKEDELHKIKEDPILNQKRSYSKMLTFAILYGASPSSIAQQIKKPLSEAQQIYDGYFKANANFKKFIDDNQDILKSNLGFRKIPIFNHEFYIGNPYHYTIKQKGLNYIIQNLSSSLVAHLAFKLYEDLQMNYGIELDIGGFIHDALDFEIDAKDLFIVMDRMRYWYKEYPLKSWNIPSDFDFSLGIDKYSGGECSYKYNDDKSEIEISLFINDYYDNKNQILNNIHKYYNVIEESILEVGLADKHPFKFLIEGVKPTCRFQFDKTKKYKYVARIKL